MKIKWYAAVLAALLLNSTLTFARQNESQNPYTALGHTPYIVGADRENELKNAIFVIENTADGTKLEHSPRTGIIKLFDSNGNLISEKQLKPNERAWNIPDPHVEKYYSYSPYNYVMNNPLKYIDPDGKDIYRYDNSSGEFILAIKNDDKFDQVGKFKHDKKTGEYTLKTNSKGEAKTSIDNIEKGILNDGINFKENDNLIQVGGEGEATVEGVESFALRLSELTHREIGGAYFSQNGANNTTHMTIGRYINNDLTTNWGHGHSEGFRNGLNQNDLTAFFHTHPTLNGDQSNRFNASPQDYKAKGNAIKNKPSMQFYILTAPSHYGGKYPHKFPY